MNVYNESKLFSFGGGVQSNAALVLASQGRIDYRHFVFANVGDRAENPETIEYIKKYSVPFAEKHGLAFYVVSRKDKEGNSVDLYDYLHKEDSKAMTIPVRLTPVGMPARRDCTNDWKIKTLNKFAKGIFAVRGIGISTDEIHRARIQKGLEYPLIDLNLSRTDCKEIIAASELPIPPKSACWFCPYKRMTDWQDLKKNNPNLFWDAVRIESMLSKRRESRGKPGVYLTDKGARKKATLDQLVSDQLEIFDGQDLTNCESGYCWT